MLGPANMDKMIDHQIATAARQSAVHDFRRARRRAALEQLLARLRGKSADLLCYEDVRDLLQARGTKMLGVKVIPVDAIVGSVGRCSDYTRSFQPLKDSDERRWTGVKNMVDGGRGLAPINVYQVGEAYFVIDGNHRVSVARQHEVTHIEAEVIEVHTRIPLTADVQSDDLPVKAEHAGFLERTALDRTHPQTDLSVTAPGQYLALEVQIEAHRQFVALDEVREVPYQEAAGQWHDTVYLPIVRMMRERGMVQEFPDQTETDLYLWVCEHRAALEEALGWEVEPDAAAADLVRQFGARRRLGFSRTSERILDAVTPDELQTGPPPGTWRNEHQGTQAECLFANILVPVSGEKDGWPAVAQAVEIACRESAQLLGVHVVSSAAEQESEQVQAVRAEFSRHRQVLGAAGMLAVEVGRMSRRVCERSRWADLIVMGLARPPAPRLASRLTSDLGTLIRSCPTPVLAVPGAFSPLSHPLLAYDGGPKAREALFVAAYLALRGQGPLVVVSILEEGLDPSMALAEAKAYLERRGVQATYVQERGPVADTILRTAEAHGSDLILMGGYGHSPVVEVLFGSAVDEVLGASQQPVLVCR